MELLNFGLHQNYFFMLDINFKASMHQWLHLDSCWSIDHVETHAKKGRVDIYISGKDLVCSDTCGSGA